MSRNSFVIVANTQIEMEVGQTLLHIIGKSGKYKAVLWDTKVYRDNITNLTSNEKIIHIGVNEYSSRSLDSIEWKFDKLSMRYGWIGSTAILEVKNEGRTKDGIKEFKNMCSQRKKEIEEWEKSKNSLNTSNIFYVLGGLLGFIFPPAWFIGLGIASYLRGYYGIEAFNAGKKLNTKLLKMEYNYLVTEFLIKDLDAFMGAAKNEEQ
ncbi:MAG: hypothetical protein FWG46_00890 [Treponema sp.]|nr:hypothetical protein [Treponema sp.]